MPGKKRSRWDGEGGEERDDSVTEVQKRTRGLHEDNNGHDGMENGISETGYLHKVMDKGKLAGPTCRNGHELILVAKEVRRLEKETPWTCDSACCPHEWDAETDTYSDRQRFRCVYYSSGGKGCNYDLCGDCYHAEIKDVEEPRRSSREIKPKYKSGQEGEWVISPKYQAKSSPEKSSPKTNNHSPTTNGIMMNGESGGSGRGRSPPMSPRTRGHTTRSSGGQQRRSSRSPPTAAGRSPRGSRSAAIAARNNAGGVEDKDLETESDFEEETAGSNRRRRGGGQRAEDGEVDSPFYPSVRFSPSVKNNGSPYGRRTTRSGGGRSSNMTSYLQSLASEDEQSEFNRQYSRDLRKRQARKFSDEGQEERRSTRLGGGGRRVHVDLDQYEGEEDMPRRTTRAARHSEIEDDSAISRRRMRSVSEDERPLASRRRRNQAKEEDHYEEEETPQPSSSRRGRRSLRSQHEEHSEEDDTPLQERSRMRGRRPTEEHYEEDDTPLEETRSSRRRGRRPADEHYEEDDTPLEETRSSRRRGRRPAEENYEDDTPLEEPRSSRRRGRRPAEEHSEEDDTPLPPRDTRRRGRRPAEEHSEEDDTPLPPRSSRRRGRVQIEEDAVEHSEDEDEGDPTVTEASVRRSSRRRGGRPMVNGIDAEDADTESGAEKAENEEEEDGETEETEDSGEEEDDGKDKEETRRSSRRNRVPVKRFSYEAQTRENIRERRTTRLENMDKYGTDEEFDGGASPKKKKYSLRTERRNTNRYQAEINGDVSTKDRGLIRSTAMSERGNRRPRERKKSRRNRTGDSSSPTSSSCSDEEAFERRKSKRMLIEREKLRPLNMNTKDVTKSIFKERSKIGASLADVQPMEMDMGVNFNSIGGLKEYVNSLKEMVMFPLLYPELFDQFKIVPPRGVLFYGPPGTGKTLLARALANECSTDNRKVAFFMRKGADCLSKWIGESERQLRLLFDQAYQMRPSIIFFDEIDGLAPVRSSRQDQIHSSIVSTLLALMDGLDNRGEIIIIGATNRIENIDPALRRPGRFDRELRFSLPCRNTRKEILKLHTKEWNPGVSEPLMNFLAGKTIGYCGADIKGLCAEAALNALRRRYPQVYESSQKLQINLQEIDVRREDFDKALRKIVPSTHRVEDKVLSPLPRHIKALLETTHTTLVANIKRLFPHSAVGKGAIIPKTLTHRPRLMIVGSEGQGQNTYIGPALLHFLEKFPCQKLDIPALFSNSARTPEEACTQIIHSARRTMPGVLYIPHLCMLWDTISDTVRATLTTLLLDIPPTAPLLILALSNRPYTSLPLDVQSMFLPFYREVFKIQNPTENERRDYFRPLVSLCTAPPPKKKETPAPVESLPVLPAPETRKLTEREEKRLKRKEEALLRELRIFLRDIWAKVNRESKFFMFRSPVNTEEVDDYLEYVKNPMDFEKMHQKLDDGEYSCAQDFLDDIDLIATNATAYNCDLAYETNRIICHRARALQDFAYALVKAEMDTDFEDECKTIVERRKKVKDKLKKMDKEKPAPEVFASPSKMQDLMAIVELACRICGKTSDDSNMLICDGCDEGYHIYCIDPPIKDVPDGDWFCPKCVAAGLNNADTNDSQGSAEIAGGGSAGSGGQKKRKRHRRSRWSCGTLNKPKRAMVKKKILDDGEGEGGSGEEGEKVDEEEKKNEETEKSNAKDNEDMDVDENENDADKAEEYQEKDEKEKDIEKSKEVAVEKEGESEGENVNSSEVISPRISLRNRSKDPQEGTSKQASSSLMTSKDKPEEEIKVLKVDEHTLMIILEELVTATEGFTVEALERTYATLAKTIRKYRSEYDRTNLPQDLRTDIHHIILGFASDTEENVSFTRVLGSDKNQFEDSRDKNRFEDSRSPQLASGEGTSRTAQDEGGFRSASRKSPRK